MSELIQMQIYDLKSQIAIWNKFSNAASKLNEEEVRREAEEDYQMVWTSNEVDYYFDYSTQPLETQFVARKAGIITNVKYGISNYYLKKGLQSCIKQIGIEIENLENSVNALKQNL